jgi:hypothetical protein
MAPNVLVGRDVMIPASTWDMEPPQAEGWPGQVIEYSTGGSSSRGGRGRRWGVMAGIDIADSRHTGAGSRKFNQSATVILTLEELKKWIVLKQGESMEEITGDARARRSAAAAAAPRQEAGTAAARGEAAAAAQGLGRSPPQSRRQSDQSSPGMPQFGRPPRSPRSVVTSSKLQGLRDRQNVFEPGPLMAPTRSDTPDKKKKRAAPRNSAGEIKPPRERDWEAHSQRENVKPLLSGVFACSAAGCKLDCKKVPDDLRLKLRDRIVSVYKRDGSHAVAQEVNAVTFYGQAKKQRQKHRTKEFFGKMTPGSTVGCAYCRTLPLAQQADGIHRLTPYQDLSESTRQREREMGSCGCPNYDAAMTKEAAIKVAAEAAEAAAAKKKRGRKQGVGNNQYYFPSLRVREYEVCRREMLHVLGQGQRGNTLARIQKEERAAPTVAAADSDRTEDPRGAKRRKTMVENAKLMDDEVKATIKDQPRSASHFKVSGSTTVKYLLDEKLNYFELWRLTLIRIQPDFIEQAEKLSFYKTFDDKDRPRPTGVPLIKPMVSYGSHTERVKQYVLAFGKLKVDLCDKCEQFKIELDRATTEDACNKVLVVWNIHRLEADASYAILTADLQAAVESWAGTETSDGRDRFATHEKQVHAVRVEHPQGPYSIEFGNFVDALDYHVQDYFGNKVTPKLNIGEAYYRQKLPTFMFGIRDMTGQVVVYCYNARVANKGPNNVISAEWHYLRTRHSGARIHIAHYDRCAGQSNNFATIRFHDFITDPEWGYQLFEQYDAKAALTGHGYSGVDAAAGRLSKQYKRDNEPEMYTKEDWMDRACSVGRSKPWEVYDFHQDAHRLWTSMDGTDDGLLDLIYRKSAPAGGWTGRIDGQEIKVKPSEYRFFNWGAGVDDDGEYRAHHGVVWMKKQLTDANAEGDRHWVKMDIRRYTGLGKKRRPLKRSDLANIDILDERFDAYDGEPLSQTEKKDNGVHMLARHAGCRCADRQCLETRARPKRTCTTLCDKWVYPPLKDSETAKRLERQWKASEDAGKHTVDTSDEEDEASQELLAELLREDELPIGALRRLGVDEKARVVMDANKLALEGAKKLGKRPRAASDPASGFSVT